MKRSKIPQFKLFLPRAGNTLGGRHSLFRKKAILVTLSGRSSEYPGIISVCSGTAGEKPVTVAQEIHPAIKATLCYAGNSRWRTDLYKHFVGFFLHPPKQMINTNPKIFKVFQNQVWNVSGTSCQFLLGLKQCKRARKTARRRGSPVCSTSGTQEAKVGASGPRLQTAREGGWRRLHSKKRASVTGWIEGNSA